MVTGECRIRAFTGDGRCTAKLHLTRDAGPRVGQSLNPQCGRLVMLVVCEQIHTIRENAPLRTGIACGGVYGKLFAFYSSRDARAPLSPPPPPGPMLRTIGHPKVASAF